MVEVIPPTGPHMHLSLPTKAVFNGGPGGQAVISRSVPESLVRNSHSQSRNKLQARYFAAIIARNTNDPEQPIPQGLEQLITLLINTTVKQ